MLELCLPWVAARTLEASRRRKLVPPSLGVKVADHHPHLNMKQCPKHHTLAFLLPSQSPSDRD